MNEALLIEQFELGPMENYIYFVGNKDTKELAVVDPAWDVDFIRKKAADNGYSIKAIILTHGHADHTNGIDELLETHDIPVYINHLEADFYNIKGDNVKKVDPGFNYQLGSVNIDFLHTPGHSPGSQCFLSHGHLVAGDTLFIDGCGRCDMKGGDVKDMFNTIHNRLMKLPNNTVIYPGHNYHHKCSDKLENQKKTNPYMLANTMESFIARRMPNLC